MPQSHFPRRLADETKSADFEDSWPSAAFVKNRGHAVRENEGAPAQFGKNLPGIYQASAGGAPEA